MPDDTSTALTAEYCDCIFKKFPIESSLFLCFVFVFLGALAGKFFYYKRDRIGAAIVGCGILFLGLTYWLI
jgi:hypothetical protein